MASKLEGSLLRQLRYYVAFVEADNAATNEQLAWVAGKPSGEDVLFSAQSDTEAYFGRLGKARDFSQRAVDFALHAGSKEAAAVWKANAALRRAAFANTAQARQDAAAALALAPGPEVRLIGALTLAQAGTPKSDAGLAYFQEEIHAARATDFDISIDAHTETFGSESSGKLRAPVRWESGRC